MIGLLSAAGAAAHDPGWIDMLHQAMHLIALVVGSVGVVVLVWGVLLAGISLVRLEVCRFRGDDLRKRRAELRTLLGFYLLLGLELLVAADIIETIIAPSLEALAVLGAIVVIRTIISVSLNFELRHEEAEIRSLEHRENT